MILASGSCRMHSLSIIPQFRAISGDSYLLKKKILYKFTNFHKLVLQHHISNYSVQYYQVNKPIKIKGTYSCIKRHFKIFLQNTAEIAASHNYSQFKGFSPTGKQD